MSGLLALLDDVASISKVAAASIDDVAGQAAKATNQIMCAGIIQAVGEASHAAHGAAIHL